ncbi:hypothetical protein D7030_14115 [Flavobacteriaceae bacterium AU392]|nr:hypothetical protein D1817_04375 [Flavobacteriaceae bacterium]RKM81438.1 hypothetical protein D7030_14115 [Flavobacteriaceae bacterium AU392]
MKIQMHLAAQYLATAGISFIEKRDDDSHTNLGWVSNLASLQTHPLNSTGDVLSLNYNSFSLEWLVNNTVTNHFSLHKKTHKNIVEWISKTSEEHGITIPYAYKLHYDLPYKAITDDYVFELKNRNELDVLISYRTLAQQAIEFTLKNYNLITDIRIWPHHFDTGSFFVDSNGIGIGVGMAIPDNMINDFYLYVSGYKGHDNIELSNTKEIKYGRYYNNEWKGIALPITGINKEIAINFYENAINNYTKPSL